ncbi:MAG: metallopeptidase family protein, partial [Thermovirgaceae bacterium]|nr:metallopeptidase family protein [Thermovirgaceae bacterium]
FWGRSQMTIMSLKIFTRFANEVIEALPRDLFKHLNGGIVVEPSAKEEGEFFILGEYIEDPGMGKIIILYYGSFRETLGDVSVGEWKEEIEDTIVHELRHHIESLAGVDDLSLEEEEEPEEDP